MSGPPSVLLDDLLQTAKRDPRVNELCARLTSGVPAHIVERLGMTQHGDIWRVQV